MKRGGGGGGGEKDPTDDPDKWDVDWEEIEGGKQQATDSDGITWTWSDKPPPGGKQTRSEGDTWTKDDTQAQNDLEELLIVLDTMAKETYDEAGFLTSKIKYAKDTLRPEAEIEQLMEQQQEYWSDYQELKVIADEAAKKWTEMEQRRMKDEAETTNVIKDFMRK